MARRSKTRDERLSIQINPPRNKDAVNRLETLLHEHMQAEFVGPLSPIQWYEREYEIARISQRHSRALIIWAMFQNKNLTDSAHDPEEFIDYFNDKNAEVKFHAEALLALLKDGHFPPAMSSVIGETRQGYLQPDGYPAFRTLERSLAARLSELIAAIETPTKSKERPKNGRGKQAVRAEGIIAVVHIWLEIDGRDFRFQRDGSDGPACGAFAEFSEQVLAAFSIKHNGLETFVREAAKLFCGMPESQLERLRNQCRVMNQ